EGAVETIQDLAGLSKTRPGMALALAIFMFSLAGIPPLAGFFGKFYVFIAAIEAGLVLLAIVGVLLSVISAFYYLRIVKLMYFDEPAPEFDVPATSPIKAVMGIAAAATVLFVVYPAPILRATEAAAQALFG
ncbi:MAG: proton-conducting transporter membrane subunit, partial [Alphaproteobacteria bacterium]|nr:proton-conducting transporter membrane subunit [Alphaproteobacteria bacterium]